MFTLPSIKLIILHKRVNMLHEAPIYLQYIHNRRVNRISLKRQVPPKAWLGGLDGKYIKERGKDSHPMAKELNFFLSRELLRGKQIIMDLSNQKRPINFSLFKDHFHGLKNDDFISYAQNFINQKSEVGFVKSSTINNLEIQLNKLKGFKASISFSDIDHRFLENYLAYLYKELKNHPNTAGKAFSFISQIFKQARKDQIAHHYPFANFKIPSKKTRHTFLTYDEVERLQRMHDAQALKVSLNNVLAYFLFACYTGLDYGDIKHLTYSDIQLYKSKYMINRQRKKTDEAYAVPLAKNALALIDTEKIGLDETIFRVVSNQKTNSFIKEIMLIVNIRKAVSYHTARHTFGTLSLNLGIPQEVVQKMMGHTTARMTSHYARVQPDYLISEMEKWDEI